MAKRTILTPLTAREAEIARLVAEGLHNKQIAKKLNISPNTVSVHLVHIHKKLNLTDRRQLMLLVLQGGLQWR